MIYLSTILYSLFTSIARQKFIKFVVVDTNVVVDITGLNPRLNFTFVDAVVVVVVVVVLAGIVQVGNHSLILSMKYSFPILQKKRRNKAELMRGRQNTQYESR